MFANDPAGGATGFDTGGSLNKSSSNLNVSGAGGVQTEISKSLLLSALTVDVVYTAGVFTSTNSSTTTWSDAATVVDDSAGTPTSGVAYLAVDTAGNVTNLGNLHAGVFTKALENLASLRAQNGGEASRLQFEQENIATQAANMEAALGRILDVDIAAETTNLAKQQILVQASASMVAQANSANQVALMLLQ